MEQNGKPETNHTDDEMYNKIKSINVVNDNDNFDYNENSKEKFDEALSRFRKRDDSNERLRYSSKIKKNYSPEVDFSKASEEFKILLIGGTGTGKSTLINTMANYFLSGSLENPKVVIPTKYFNSTESEYFSQHSESSLDDVTKSKTTKCLTYTFTHPKNSSLKFNIIDSPGLSDTGGTKQDDKNIVEIINNVINAGSLSAIIVTANGTEPRVTTSIRNTLFILANNLPDELINNNLLLVLTKCSKLSASFSVEAFEAEISNPWAVFYMDNQAFCSDPKTWKSDAQSYNELQFKWKQSHQTFDNLLKSITGLPHTSTDSFINMIELRNNLKSEIATISQDIVNIQKVQDSLETAKIEAQKSSDLKNSFTNYTKTETITIITIIPSEYHSTVCTKHLLQDFICHELCGIDYSEQCGSNNFSRCKCMDNNNKCRICGCGPQSHYHDMVKLESKTTTIEKVLEDKKCQFDAADANYKKFSADQNNFQISLEKLQATVDQKYLKIHELCYDLSKICSRFNFVEELHANIENMKQDAKIIKSIGIRLNAENEINKLVILANDLSANFQTKKIENLFYLF